MRLLLDNEIRYQGQTLIAPSFHDANIVAFRLETKGITIDLVTTRKSCYSIKLCGLVHIKADDFREANIVLGIYVVNKEYSKDSHLLKLYGLDRPSDEAWFRTLVTNLEKGALRLFTIAPSCGCELAAVCERIEIYEAT